MEKNSPSPNNGGFVHNEAFCLMYYENKDTKTGFMVWNSRDGVTPFLIFDNGKEYYHQHWMMDKRILPTNPMHKKYLDSTVLVKGQKVFRDTSREEAEILAIKRLNSAKGTKYEVQIGTDRWNELVKSLTEDFMGEPHMVTIEVDGMIPIKQVS